MYTTSFTDVPLGELLVRVQTLKHRGVRFVQMCAEKDGEDNLSLLYTFYDETRDEAVNLVIPVTADAEVPSIQELYFAAFSYENETHDLFGIRFVNMKLDFGGHFFNLAAEAPMTILSPEQKAAREKAAKLKAAQEAKAAKAAREAAEQAAAEKAMGQSAAEADAAEAAKLGGKGAASVESGAGDTSDMKVLHGSGAAMQDQSSEEGQSAGEASKPAGGARKVPYGSEAAIGDQSGEVPSAAPAMDERTAKMVAKLAAMPPEKASKLRENLAAKGIIVPEIPPGSDVPHGSSPAMRDQSSTAEPASAKEAE